MIKSFIRRVFCSKKVSKCKENVDADVSELREQHLNDGTHGENVVADVSEQRERHLNDGTHGENVVADVSEQHLNDEHGEKIDADVSEQRERHLNDKHGKKVDADVSEQRERHLNDKHGKKVDADVSEQRDLPHELINVEILTRLPIASVLRFKSVSKQWYSTLSSHQFGNIHSKFSSSSSPTQFMFIQTSSSFYIFHYNEADNKVMKLELDDFGVEGDNVYTDATEIVSTSTSKPGNSLLNSIGKIDNKKLHLIGSCNGLVCLACDCDFILWNPVTHQFRKVGSGLENLLNSSSTDYRVSWGFGYVSSSDDYKIVRILELPSPQEIIVHVFSMKSNFWRRIDPERVSLLRGFDGAITDARGNCYSFNTCRGVLCNESLHWIVASIGVHGWRVVAFDLVQETFETCQNPALRSGEIYRDKFLCVMRGCLSTYGSNMRGDAYVDMYKRYDDGRTRYEEKERESIRLFRDLDLSSCSDLIDFSGSNGKFFVLKNMYREAHIGVVDSGSKPVIYKRLVTFKETRNTHFTSYAPSLVSPLSPLP